MSSVCVIWAALLGGLTSSIGPCVAPRYLLMASQLAAGATLCEIALFIAGCICGYLTFALAGFSFSFLALSSHIVYMMLSAVLISCGLVTLLWVPCACVSVKLRGVPGSLGSRFLLGVSCTLIGSPCCAPIALAIGLQAEQHDPKIAAATLVAFGIGHAAPLLACAIAASSQTFRNLRLPFGASATVSGSLLTAVGALYAIIA